MSQTAQHLLRPEKLKGFATCSDPLCWRHVVQFLSSAQFEIAAEQNKVKCRKQKINFADLKNCSSLRKHGGETLLFAAKII